MRAKSTFLSSELFLRALSHASRLLARALREFAAVSGTAQNKGGEKNRHETIGAQPSDFGKRKVTTALFFAGKANKASIFHAKRRVYLPRDFFLWPVRRRFFRLDSNLNVSVVNM